ncbi:MAG: hypothetical protein GF381_04580 [Candidatus Pacebacteria bacterium]|nr:hypothetical protein [Candidatus Paceibacterota bacterium]
MSKLSSKVVFVLLGLIFIAASWALFKPGFFKIHDFTQAARVAEMSRALQDGHFPVRWTQNFGFGYGMPLFEFYGPLPYYFGALFYWLGLDLVLVLKIIFLTTNLGTLLGAYLLGKKLFNRQAGILLAAALTLAPYRAVNLFVRGALSEAWGIMALPWILLGIVKVVNREKHAWIWLSLSLIVLFLSHNLSILIFFGFSVLFAVFYWFSRQRLKSFQLEGDDLYCGQLKSKVENRDKHSADESQLAFVVKELVLAGITAFGASAFYLVPSYLEKDLTQVRDIVLGDYFNFRLHFLYLRQFFQPNWGYRGSEWGPNDGFSFFLGWGQLFSLGLTWLTLVFAWFKSKRKVWQYFSGLVVVWSGLMINALLLTTQKTLFIWERLSLLEFIQFPWRFLLVATLFLSLIISGLPGLIASLIKGKNPDHKVESRAKTKQIDRRSKSVTLVLTGLIIATNFYYFRPESQLTEPEGIYYSDPERIAREMSGILPDYLPQGVSQKIQPAEPKFDQDQVLVNKTHQKLIKLDLEKEELVEFSLADFPGWRLEIDGQPVAKQTSPNGLISVLVPEGEHQVGLIFGSTPVRQLSDWISLTFWLFLFYNLFITLKDDQSNRA